VLPTVGLRNVSIGLGIALPGMNTAADVGQFWRKLSATVAIVAEARSTSG
jgi:hypothetical protein